jgi:hypothetical protein
MTENRTITTKTLCNEAKLLCNETKLQKHEEEFNGFKVKEKLTFKSNSQSFCLCLLTLASLLLRMTSWLRLIS